MGIIGCYLSCSCSSGAGVTIDTPGKSCVRIDGAAASCGHCGELIYPAVQVIAEHDFICRDGVLTWHSRAMGLDVHRCDQAAEQVTERELLDLTAPTSV